ncbi:MAG: type II secretion system F family protein [Candidatus Altiarchaeota archaeon]
MPKKLRILARERLQYSNFNIDPEKFLGFALIFGLGVGFILGSIINQFNILPLPIGFVTVFILFEFFIYIWITLSSDSKAKFVEEVLPDALQLMSSNIRAGLTTDKALLMAARPEFGPLEYEIRRIGKETMAGKSLTEALYKMTARIKSKNLERTLDLISQSIKSGGKLADLLDQTATDLRDQQIVQKEISASVLMYVFFILIAIGLGAPALFSLSSFLVTLLTKNMEMIARDLPTNMDAMSRAMPISITTVRISPDFVRTYSIISLAASSFFGSMVVGLIMTGEERQGLKYFPMLLLLSVGLFFLGGFILDQTLGGMLKI